MPNIREEAHIYEPPKTLNIADLPKVSIELDLKDGVGREGEPDEFKYKYIVVDNKEYRVPGSVLGMLKELLVELPGLMFFKVTKTGEGVKTRYQIIPFQEQVESVAAPPADPHG